MSKLVRDLIPDIIRKNGETPNVHVADHEEYRRSLYAKLEEELAEFRANPTVEELADLSEVIRAIEHFYGWDVERERLRKHRERGGFAKRYILE